MLARRTQVVTKDLDEGSFQATLVELAARHAAGVGQSAEAAQLPSELLADGLAWAQGSGGGLSVRAASMHIARCAAVPA